MTFLPSQSDRFFDLTRFPIPKIISFENYTAKLDIRAEDSSEGIFPNKFRRQAVFQLECDGWSQVGA